MLRWILNACFSLVIFIVGVGGTCLPGVIYRMGKKVNGIGLLIFHLGNSMSGGAMVGGALCHLLPDAMEDLGTISFPLAGALTGVGYIVTVLIEAIAVSIMDSIGAQHSHQLNDDHQDLEGMWIQGDNDSVYQIPHLDHSLCHENTEGEDLCDTVNSSAGSLIATEFGMSARPALYSTNNRIEDKKGTFIASLTLGFALSYHSMLTGMAVGSQASVQTTLNLMYVVLAHKMLEAYALGSSLVNCRATWTRTWILTISYSATLPLGVLAGYFFLSGTGGTLTGILSGLSAGTFLFVGIGEIITTELANPSHKFKKIFCVMIGFLAMVLLALME